MVTSLERQIKEGKKALPVSLRHVRQWQSPNRFGSPAIVSRIAPQLHPLCLILRGFASFDRASSDILPTLLAIELTCHSPGLVARISAERGWPASISIVPPTELAKQLAAIVSFVAGDSVRQQCETWWIIAGNAVANLTRPSETKVAPTCTVSIASMVRSSSSSAGFAERNTT